MTFIGDSIGDALQIEPQAKTVLGRGTSLDLEVAVCRRLVGTSCPYQGVNPLTLVDLVPTIDLAPTVVVEVGYNDYESTFPQSVESALAALKKGGATRVLWLTMREERDQYANMNDDLKDAATRHPELTLVDWDAYSRNHQDWFQSDGLHLDYAGAMAMATLVQKALRDVGVLPRAAKLAIATRTLPGGRVGRRYAARLRASGGIAPLTWTLQKGSLPRGLRLRAGGSLTGTPRASGSRTLTFRVRDTSGQTQVRRLTLAVRPASGG